MTQTPTKEFYGSIEAAYNFFNESLFESALPPCIIVISRRKDLMGYLMYQRWASTAKKDFRSELAINPGYIAKHPMQEFFQTVVHEQCHLWQFMFGKPSQRSYHNREWAGKMESFGLMPSNTGAPGGKRTGQKMSDYAAPDGKFIQLCEEFAPSFRWLWVDRAQYPPVAIKEYDQAAIPDQIFQLLTTPLEDLENTQGLIQEEDSQQGKPKSKVKYTCACKKNVWGKPGLDITCNLCGKPFAVNK